ncbi:MAG TPA: glycosyl hydrolase family 18 protein, partial [Candidatus Paceibacterota bacterium]|nr:glycosyl hydrolase family 18 protein [Candidatus Paceibacterota bacterium]
MKRAALGALFVSLLAPLVGHAAGTFEVSGWIPYWRAASGTQDALAHASSFTSLMPFGYVVQNDGSLHDSFALAEAASSSTSTAAALLTGAKSAGVKVVPSVMWSNGSATHAILSSQRKRIALENAIAKVVKDNQFDGIDIDFESKIYESRAYFSLFLQGLKSRLGKKLLYCAIEPRTPPSSYFDVIPEKLQYVNDYYVIGKYCDRVEIMAYDQGTTDLRLNAAAAGRPYIPVSDPLWVKKVATLASGFIDKKKLVLGIPTYGYEYELSRLTQGYRYRLQWALNPAYAVQLAGN